MNPASTVSLVSVQSYDMSVVEQALRDCLAPLGGMQAFVSPGQRVLLKPNVLGGFAPEKAVTTHPAVLRAAVILVKECGGIPLVGDSPGIGELVPALKAAGLYSVIQEQSAELADFTNESVFDTPDNTVGRHLKLAQAVRDADVIISLPKLKTHVQMTFTGAVKNQFGLVLGMKKGNYHFRLKDREQLAALIVDINRAVTPALAVFDAIVAMEGAGPSGGEPRRLGLLMASADLTALDVVACRVINLDPASVPTIEAAARVGYGTVNPPDIEIVGENIDAVRVPDFKKVEHFKSVLGILPLPQFMLKWLRELWAPRPRITAELCISCYRCRDGCPVEPAAIDPDRSASRQVDDSTCIRCYCCHEFCPVKAIELKRSLADRLLNFSKLFDWCSRKLGRLISKFSI